MTGLLHGFGEGNATIGGFGEIAGAQTMGRKFRRVETRHLRAPLDDGVDGTGFQCPRGNIAPSIDFSKHVAFVDPGCLQPSGEGIDGTSGQIDNFILFDATGFGTAKMDAKRGEGRAFLIGDRCLFDELICAQACYFAATTSTGGKGHHQNGPVSNVCQVSF